jgi:hypothetical protein
LNFRIGKAVNVKLEEKDRVIAALKKQLDGLRLPRES